MKVIYKYTIGTAFYGDNITTIKIPKDAKLLYIGQQNDDICAWYEINTAQLDNLEEFTWYQIGTGHPYDDKLSELYKGSIINNEARLVWHMFSEKIS